MKRFFRDSLLASFLIISFFGDVRAQTISAGDVAIVGVNSLDQDEFAFLALVDLAEGTEISFTDRGWPQTGEGDLTFRALESVEKGTVIRMYPPANGPSFDGGDQLIAYQGTPGAATFIYALNFNGNGIWESHASDQSFSGLPPGLQDGFTAVAVYECANIAYVRSLEGRRSDILASIGNRANWTCDNTRPLDFELIFGHAGYGLPSFGEPLDSVTISVEEQTIVKFNAADPDSEILFYSISPDLPAGAIFSTTTGRFWWTPSPGQEGIYSFFVRASDGMHSVAQDFQVVVVGPIPRPYFTIAPENQFINGRGRTTFQYEALDPNGENVILTRLGLGYDLQEYWYSIEPIVTLNQNGTPNIYEYQIRATNTSGVSAYHTHYFIVFGTYLDYKSGSALYRAIKDAFTPSQTPGLSSARSLIFEHVDLSSDGFVCGIYSGYPVELTGGDPVEEMSAAGMDLTHIWPESSAVTDEPQRSDMNVLFPARMDVIETRGLRRFADIPDDETEMWYRQGESQSSKPTDNLDEYSELAGDRFEPPESIKGDIARAFFYYYTVYRSNADPEYFLNQVDAMENWAEADPVSIDEALRAFRIKEYQGAFNPFVLDPTLHRRLYPPRDVGTGFLQNDSETTHGAGITLNELSARAATDFNADGQQNLQFDMDEFIEIVNASSSAIDINGWTLGDNSEVVTLSGLDPVAPYTSVVVFTKGADISNFEPGQGNQATVVSGIDLDDIFDSLGLKNLDGVYVSVHWGAPPASSLSAAFLNGAVIAGENTSFSTPWTTGESKTRVPDFTGTWISHPAISGIHYWSQDGVVNLHNPTASPGRTYRGVALFAEEDTLPDATNLTQNYPNPFNPRTSILYTLERSGWVELNVYNVLGELVEILGEGIKPAGVHEETFDATGLSSGVYFYTLSTSGYRKTLKMVLLR